MHRLISGLSICFIYLCLTLCQCYTVLITIALQNSLKSGYMISLTLFFLKTVLATIVLQDHTNFRIICCSSVKSAIGILRGITLHLQITLGNMDILTFFQFMKTEYLSNYFYHLQFLSAIAYSFQSTGVLPSCLNLFLVFYSF